MSSTLLLSKLGSLQRRAWALRPLSPNAVLLLVASYLCLTQNHALWLHVKASVADLPTGSALQIGLSALMSLLSLTCVLLGALAPRRLLKPILITALLLAPALGYFMDSFDTAIDMAMIQSLFETNLRESRELLNLGFLGRILLWALIPALLLGLTPIQRISMLHDFAH